VFVELDTCQDAGFMVSPEWNRNAGNTRIVVADRHEGLLVFCIPGANAKREQDPRRRPKLADRPTGVGLVTQHLSRLGPGPARAASADPDPGHDRLEGQRVVAVPCRGHPRDRSAAVSATR
jgi:hypothetical protein